MYIGQKGGALNDVPEQHPAIDEVYSVRAGKFRRYHGRGLKQLFYFDVQAKNLRDAVWTLIGTWQSYWLLRRLRPRVIFTRGGYVSVPVALGGKLNGIPYITHDSDSTPSLANRIIARWADLHAVALPEKLYPYPRQKTLTVGVPVSSDYVKVDTKLQHKYRSELGIDHHTKMLFITGGGNGAAQLNKVVAENVPALLAEFPDLIVVHVAGRDLEADLNSQYDALLQRSERQRVIVKAFVGDMYRYSGAADVIIARAGASSLAEFAIQGKACIIIPASQLVWQTHQAKTLADQDAIMYLPEKESLIAGKLRELVADLLSHDAKRQSLADNLAKLSQTDTAKRVAMLLLEK